MVRMALNLKSVLTAILTSSLVIANVTAAKIASLGGIIVPAGFVGIAVAFLTTDILSERYGKESAQSAVNGTIIALIVGWILVYVSVLMPSAPFYDATAFNSVMRQSANIVLASIITLSVSQNVDVSLFHKIRSVTDYKFARNIGSTSVSQFVDTTLFITLGFIVFPALLGGTVMGVAAAAQMIVAQYAVKVGAALLDTPLFYAFTE